VPTPALIKALRILDNKKLAGLHAAQILVNTGRPPDFDVGRGRGTEAEVQAFVIRGEIAPGGSCKPT